MVKFGKRRDLVRKGEMEDGRMSVEKWKLDV
jgi:hypothetical protein